MKEMIILRGLPGSGKSRFAELLVSLANGARGSGGYGAEADDFFIDDEGVYVFNSALLAEAHTDCKVRVKEALEAEVPLVVVSNTSTTNWEMDPYVDMARLSGYTVTVLTVEPGITLQALAERNVHGCPLGKIEMMNARWEPFFSRG